MPCPDQIGAQAISQAVAIAKSIAQGAAGAVGVRSGAEEPLHKVVERIADNVEVRRYPARLAADVTVEGDEIQARSAGFRRLAGFIFGANTARARIDMTAPVGQARASAPGGSEKIAMTAPVGQTRTGDGRWTIRFFMPAHFTRESLPVPRDRGIDIVEAPEETVAVITFSGLPTAEAVRHHQKLLLRMLAARGTTVVGEPVAWFYDPPWTIPFLRRNEVAVAIAP